MELPRQNPFKVSEPINLVTAYPGPPLLYIGNLAASKDRNLLRSLGITRVIQVLEDDRSPFKDDGIEYLPISVEDAVSGADLLPWFPKAVEFVDEIQQSGRAGNVLVHCRMGSSRSGSVVVALLMWKLRSRGIGRWRLRARQDRSLRQTRHSWRNSGSGSV